jgi:predicted CoA-binding protein
MTIEERIACFLASDSFAVAGASTDREKYGNKVLRCYMQHGKRVVPVNPHASSVEGLASVPRVSDLPDHIQSLSVITPPRITEQVVEEAIIKGIRNIWMQPGAQSPLAVARCEEAGINLIADGSCLLVVLGYHES